MVYIFKKQQLISVEKGEWLQI